MRKAVLTNHTIEQAAFTQALIDDFGMQSIFDRSVCKLWLNEIKIHPYSKSEPLQILRVALIVALTGQQKHYQHLKTKPGRWLALSIYQDIISANQAYLDKVNQAKSKAIGSK